MWGSALTPGNPVRLIVWTLASPMYLKQLLCKSAPASAHGFVKKRFIKDLKKQGLY